MAKPISDDLRAHVVDTVGGGATIPEAAEQCGVSIRSVVRFLKLYRETGCISPAQFGGYKDFALAEHEDLVRHLVAEQPDITLEELGVRLANQGITVGKSSISRFLHHLKLTCQTPSGTAPFASSRTAPLGLMISVEGWCRR
jgi:transposase